MRALAVKVSKVELAKNDHSVNSSSSSSGSPSPIKRPPRHRKLPAKLREPQDELEERIMFEELELELEQSSKLA